MIGGAGFANMAWTLACIRTNRVAIHPVPRSEAAPWPVSAEYYRIIDRAAEAFRLGTLGGCVRRCGQRVIL